MSQVAAPFGLRAVIKRGGSTTSEPASSSILSTYNTNIFQGAPVKIGTNGTIELAAVGERAIGLFQGVEYTDTFGSRKVVNKWVAATVGTDIVAYYTEDPYLLYEIQANATVAQADVGKQMDWTVATGGNATTGISAVALDVASSAANAGLQILGLIPGPDNAWDDPFPIVLVRFSEHQYVADIAAF